MKSKTSRPLIYTTLSLATGMIMMTSRVALGEQPPAPIQASTAAEAAAPAETSATSPVTQLSDGSPMQFADLKMNISPVTGWEARSGGAGITLVMQEPNIEPFKINNEEIKFQRNVTVVTRHKPTPIDDQAVEEFRTELTDKMSKDAMVSGFQIIEAKRFNYRGQNDGILIYSQMKLGAAQVMQAHVKVSGASNHFWITYTDLAERFSSDQESFKKVWQSMTSINVEGVPQRRYFDLIVFGGSAVGVLTLLGAFSWFRRRRAGSMYEEVANEVYEDEGDINTPSAASAGGESVTQSDVWALTAVRAKEIVANEAVVENDADTGKDDSDAVWSHQVSSVSNFA
jgi:hypothetical protein